MNTYYAYIAQVKTPDSKFTIVTSFEDISILLAIAVSATILLGGIINMISRYVVLRHQLEAMQSTLLDHEKELEELRRICNSLQRQIDRNTARHDKT